MLLPACHGRDLLAPEDLPAGLQLPTLSVGSWERVHRDAFSFALPPGFEKQPGVPIDSDAASYARGTAQLVSYRLDGRYVVRGWWEKVDRSSLGDLHLLMRGESDTAAGREALLAVLHSVRFD